MAVRLACARCGVTLTVAEYEDVARAVAEQMEKCAEFAGDPADPDRAWCAGCVRERRWRDTEPTRLSESERHAAIAKAMRTVDVEWLAEMVLIDHDVGPLPPSPEESA